MHPILEDINRTSIQLMLKEPFYGHFFSGLTKEITDAFKTMAVGAVQNNQIRLYINAVFWNNVLTTEAFRYGVLKHEILHIVFKHIFTAASFRNKHIANIAADIVVNQYIEKSQLPKGAVLLENYAMLNMQANMDKKYYYDHLINILKKGDNNPAKRQLLIDIDKFKNNSNIDIHGEWYKLSALEKRLLEKAIDVMVKEQVLRAKANGSFGQLPMNIKLQLDSFFILKENIDWRRTLRIFATSSQGSYLKNTMRRPSKRYGTTPGIQLKKRNKLLVAIDTSGSINQRDLKLFFSEIYHIYKSGAEIMVVECDAAIQNKYTYNGQMQKTVFGGGGTSFEAPLQYANEEYHPDAIIYFTDGFAPSPQTTPRAPLLWLITPNGLAREHWDQLKGRKVRLMG